MIRRELRDILEAAHRLLAEAAAPDAPSPAAPSPAEAEADEAEAGDNGDGDNADNADEAEADDNGNGSGDGGSEAGDEAGDGDGDGDKPEPASSPPGIGSAPGSPAAKPKGDAADLGKPDEAEAEAGDPRIARHSHRIWVRPARTDKPAGAFLARAAAVRRAVRDSLRSRAVTESRVRGAMLAGRFDGRRAVAAVAGSPAVFRSVGRSCLQLVRFVIVIDESGSMSSHAGGGLSRSDLLRPLAVGIAQGLNDTAGVRADLVGQATHSVCCLHHLHIERVTEVGTRESSSRVLAIPPADRMTEAHRAIPESDCYPTVLARYARPEDALCAEPLGGSNRDGEAVAGAAVDAIATSPAGEQVVIVHVCDGFPAADMIGRNGKRIGELRAWESGAATADAAATIEAVRGLGVPVFGIGFAEAGDMEGLQAVYGDGWAIAGSLDDPAGAAGDLVRLISDKLLG
jgi:hypothetical protein